MFFTLRSVEWLKPLRSAGIVTIGEVARAAMSLAYVAMAVRVLGAEGFGMLVLVHGTVFGLSQIVRLQTWQAVIRYGAAPLHRGEKIRLQRLIRFTTALDTVAAVAGLVLIMLIIAPVGQLFKIPPNLHDTIRLYSLSIVLIIMTSTPRGILRLLDRFDLIAVQTAIAPFVRLAGTFYLFIFGGGLTDFLMVWFAAIVAARLTMFVLAWWELKRQKLLDGMTPRLDGRLCPESGIWRFVLAYNLIRTLYVSQAHIGLLMVGALLGPASAGIFRVAQQLADVLAKPGSKILMPAIFSELAKLHVAGNHLLRKNMVVRMALLAGGAGLVYFLILVIVGEDLIEIFVGPEFAAAYAPTLWLSIAGLFGIFTFPVEPLLSTAGRIRPVVLAHSVSMLFYVVALLALLPTFGLPGAGMATLTGVVTSATILMLAAWDLIFDGQPTSND